MTVHLNSDCCDLLSRLIRFEAHPVEKALEHFNLFLPVFVALERVVQRLGLVIRACGVPGLLAEELLCLLRELNTAVFL
jgi:hypothetical protein